MRCWERYREEKKQREEIELQIQRIELLSKIVPIQTLEVELWGGLLEEEKTLRNAEQWLAVLQTAHLRRKAERYGIEMPDPENEELGKRMDWAANQHEPYYMTSKGMRLVNLALREEEKYRWDKWNARIAATTAPLSLVVAILALVIGK